MKRIALLSIALVMGLGMLACQRGEPAKTEEAAPAAIAPAPAPEPAPVPATEGDTGTEEDTE